LIPESGAAGQRGPGGFRRFHAVAGANSEVLVGDNQLLKKGDPIDRLDPRYYEMALAQAGAKLSGKFIL
jgi:multidrug efflux pump subunit AcrA (membrane-fusion protein)